MAIVSIPKVKECYVVAVWLGQCEAWQTSSDIQWCRKAFDIGDSL